MNLDKLKLFPNQVVEGDPTECVGLTVADILGNHFGVAMNPDFTYAASLYIQGKEPTTAGTDPRAGMFSACAYGVLPQLSATFTAQTMGELYAANFANFTASQKAIASAYRIASKPVAPDWLSVLAKLDAGVPISLPMKWYQNFSYPIQGVLQAPQGIFDNHNVAVYGYDSRGLIFKPWLGSSYGDGGYGYMSQDIYEQVRYQPYCFDPNASILLQTISLSIVYYPLLRGLFKNLVS